MPTILLWLRLRKTLYAVQCIACNRILENQQFLCYLFILYIYIILMRFSSTYQIDNRYVYLCFFLSLENFLRYIQNGLLKEIKVIFSLFHILLVQKTNILIFISGVYIALKKAKIKQRKEKMGCHSKIPQNRENFYWSGTRVIIYNFPEYVPLYLSHELIFDNEKRENKLRILGQGIQRNFPKKYSQPSSLLWWNKQ